MHHNRSETGKGVLAPELLWMANFVRCKGTLDRPLCRTVCHYLDFAAR